MNFIDRVNTVIDESTDEGKLQAKAKKQNAYAFVNYTLAFNTEDLMRKIESAKMLECPGGLAYLVANELTRDFRLKETISRVEMGMAMSKIKMGAKVDPKKLKERLRAVENRYNYGVKKIDKDDLVAVVLSQAHVQYSGVLMMM